MSHADADSRKYYPTPAEAAIADIPRPYARVLWSGMHNDLCVVWVEENTPPVLHWSIDLVYRYPQGWRLYGSSGGWAESGEAWDCYDYLDVGENEEDLLPGVEISLISTENASMIPESSGAYQSRSKPIHGYVIVVDWVHSPL